MSPAIPQGTGFTTMPHGLTAEVEMERYEWWVAASPALRRRTRVMLEGGPFDAWAWDVSLVPDQFVCDAGQYHPLLQSNRAIINNEPVVFVWSAVGSAVEGPESGGDERIRTAE